MIVDVGRVRICEGSQQRGGPGRMLRVREAPDSRRDPFLRASLCFYLKAFTDWMGGPVAF